MLQQSTPAVPEVSIEDAMAFARTLRGKDLSGQIGQLMLAFEGMDLPSAKMILMIRDLEDRGAGAA
jgi:hypothetical protein